MKNFCSNRKWCTPLLLLQILLGYSALSSSSSLSFPFLVVVVAKTLRKNAISFFTTTTKFPFCSTRGATAADPDMAIHTSFFPRPSRENWDVTAPLTIRRSISIFFVCVCAVTSSFDASSSLTHFRVFAIYFWQIATTEMTSYKF